MTEYSRSLLYVKSKIRAKQWEMSFASFFKPNLQTTKQAIMTQVIQFLLETVWPFRKALWLHVWPKKQGSKINGLSSLNTDVTSKKLHDILSVILQKVSKMLTTYSLLLACNSDCEKKHCTFIFASHDTLFTDIILMCWVAYSICSCRNCCQESQPASIPTLHSSPVDPGSINDGAQQNVQV